MDTVILDAQPRDLGKSAAAAVRRAEDVPCVLYGHAQAPLHFRVPVKALRPLIYTKKVKQAHVRLDGATYPCLVKALDFHPVSDEPIHADFLALNAEDPVVVTIPLLLQGTPAGVKLGGKPRQTLTQIQIKALPADLISFLDVDVTGLEIGQTLKVSDLSIPNVEILSDANRAILTIIAPKRAVETTTAAPTKGKKK